MTIPLLAALVWWPSTPATSTAREAWAPPLQLPSQQEDTSRLTTLTDPASLRLRERRVRGRIVWAQPEVSAEQVEWAVRGWELAAARLPSATGLAVPTEPLSLHLFADGEAFRRLTSQLTGLPPTAIHAFEGGRSYASGARRGIYVNTGAVPSAEQSARLVAHELVHLAERDLLGTRSIPRWFSEGLAEHVAQQVMMSVNLREAEQRHWRRGAALASALHRNVAYPLSGLTSPGQWGEAAAAGYDRLIYSEALLATEWLLTQGGPGAAARLLGEVARDRGFGPALEATTGLAAPTLDARVDAALRARLLPQYPVGIHVYQSEAPPGARFQFAAVGLPAREVLTRQFIREDGYAARDSGAPGVTSLAGIAYWTFQTRPDSMPATWWVTVEGDQGTWARIPFHVVSDTESPAGP
jgi:hypothetical protein